MIYSELVNAAKAYADRQDLEVSDSIDTFIIMAEARINRVLKTREQTKRIYTPTADGREYYSLPPDYAGMRDIQINSELPSSSASNCSLIQLNPDQFNVQRSKSANGSIFYTVIANQIQITPMQAGGKTLELVYYQKVPNLNGSNDSNWLSENHPDIYLAGMVAEIEAFAKNYDVSSNWDSRMSRAISELDNSDMIERWSGVSLTTRIG